MRRRLVGLLYLLAGIWNVAGCLHFANEYSGAIRGGDLPAGAVLALSMVMAAFAFGVTATVGASGFLLNREWGRRTLRWLTRTLLVGGVVAAVATAIFAIREGDLAVALVPLLALAPWAWMFRALDAVFRLNQASPPA
jgi:hypothetical protein